MTGRRADRYSHDTACKVIGAQQAPYTRISRAVPSDYHDKLGSSHEDVEESAHAEACDKLNQWSMEYRGNPPRDECSYGSDGERRESRPCQLGHVHACRPPQCDEVTGQDKWHENNDVSDRGAVYP